MTTKEFAVFVKTVQSCYPRDTFLPTDESKDVWYEMLKDLPYKLVEASLRKHLATSKWSPTIAEIREGAVAVQSNIQDWSEAWEEARRAVRKFGSYQEAEALAWMNPSTAETVKRFGYYDLCMMENPEVAKAHFRDIYSNIEMRTRKEAQLPDSLKGLIESIRIGENLLEDK